MKTAKTSVYISLQGSDSALINWGDGTNNTYQLSATNCPCTHTYSSSSERTITITGATITYLDCGNNQLTSLNVTGNPSLTALCCLYNSLTSLGHASK
jgi:Leucine-rich repeat (LRR) protein